MTLPGVSLLVPKLIYVVINLGSCGLILYKFKSMGLLPLTSADWVSLIPERLAAEHSSMGMPFV